tara:strand:+ start:2575 stop:2871 length:297 start_codon:yes stop_codon:yes gene_type:complete
MVDAHGPVLHADGFEDAVIGIAQRCGETPVVIYSYAACIAAMVRKGMSEHEAMEFIEFNLVGAWCGPGTPMLMHEMGFAEVEEYAEGWESARPGDAES